MPNIATALKEEIARLARKEIRRQSNALKKASAQYRTDIATMKRRVIDLQRKLTRLEKQVLKKAPAQPAEVDAEHVRFTAKGLRSQRRRLGLSAVDCGKLLGVTDQTIYNWERGQTRPRQAQLAKTASLRRLGKRDAQVRLEQLAGGSRKK